MDVDGIPIEEDLDGIPLSKDEGMFIIINREYQNHQQVKAFSWCQHKLNTGLSKNEDLSQSLCLYYNKTDGPHTKAGTNKRFTVRMLSVMRVTITQEGTY